MMVVVLVVFQSICAAFGFAIGRSKGRPVLGVLLGYILGIFGLIIIAVLREGPPRPLTPAGR